MSESKRILVGIDGSEYSPAALRLAGRLASALGAPLHVVTCLGYSNFYLPERGPRRLAGTAHGFGERRLYSTGALSCSGRQPGGRERLWNKSLT
jgi:Universal stress protein family